MRFPCLSVKKNPLPTPPQHTGYNYSAILLPGWTRGAPGPRAPRARAPPLVSGCGCDLKRQTDPSNSCLLILFGQNYHYLHFLLKDTSPVGDAGQVGPVPCCPLRGPSRTCLPVPPTIPVAQLTPERWP